MSHRVPRALFIAFSCAAALLPSSVWAQNAQRSASSQQRLYLVFPFENNGSSPRLDWLGEGLEELTIQYLSDAGEQVYSHAGRASELERYGLPTSAKLSRATMLRIAQDLDADYVIFGSFNSDGTNLTVNSHVLRVDPPALTAPVSETGPLSSLMDMQAKVVWHTLVANDKSYPLALAEFSKSLRPLRLDAFEHFVRGILANEDEPRLRELREAARLDPNWPDPAYALGETYAGKGDCDSALPWFGRVPKTNPHYVEANFAIGVCRLRLNQPDKAEQVLLRYRTRFTATKLLALPARLRERTFPKFSTTSVSPWHAKERCLTRKAISSMPSNSIPTKTTIPSTSACSSFALMISTRPSLLFAKPFSANPTTPRIALC